MNVKQLFKLELGAGISIFNEPFTYVGHAQIELDGGHTMRWLYDDEGRMLSISPHEEELILFREVDDEIEPEEEMILFQGKEYEFNYEDAGNVIGVEGESATEEEDRFMFTDYQATGGGIIRLIENENTGESTAYVGVFVSDEDVTQM
ncbi:DUF4178 domain-containing protein [Candidatus Uhrbacteria bacterium]|nr:DUF4178 domain-containing protein [Candidatus Uhrbacteria bacterium]